MQKYYCRKESTGKETVQIQIQKGRCCVSNQRILCNNPSIFVRYPSFWRKPGFPGGTRNACKRYCAEKEKNIFYTLDTHTVHFKSFVLAYLHRKALRPHDSRRLNNYEKSLSLSTVRGSRKIKRGCPHP